MKKNPYEDILHFPHPEPRRHPRMSRENRAAQFAPFAALTGYDAAIQEAGRRTSGRIFLEESEIEFINNQLLYLKAHPFETASILFFLPDARKEGGSYETYTGLIKKIDTHERKLVTFDGPEIPFSDIAELSIVSGKE